MPKLKIKTIEKLITGVTAIIVMLLMAIFTIKLLKIPVSIAVDKVEPKIEANLNKYVNYKISEQEKGTLVQYSIRTGVKYQDNQNYVPLRESEINVDFDRIDNKYPFSVKVISQNTQATNGNNQANFAYNSSTGKLIIYASNKNESEQAIYNNGNKDEKDEYTIACYYDTYSENKPQRTAKFNIDVKYQFFTEDNTQVSKNGEFSKQVSETIGNLTSIQTETDEIYNGNIKSNIINGTQYATDYKEKQKIEISKKELQEKLQLAENNTFIQISSNEQGEEVTQNIGNNKNLVYKTTKINKREIQNLLGENGTLQITDLQGNILAQINKDTQYAEDGTYTIVYMLEPEAIVVKTSKIQNEGILSLEHTKEIKPTMTNIANTKIQTTTELKGTKELQTIENGQTKVTENEIFKQNNENIVDIKEAQTEVEVKLNSEEWTNEKQNEVTFEVKLNSNGAKYNMYKNPSIRMELPEEVEKVILGESSLLYGNGLELQEVKLEENENGSKAIVATIEGAQTQYIENNLDLQTYLQIPAVVILKKDLLVDASKIKVNCSNEYTVDNTIEEKSFEKEIKVIDYKEIEAKEENNESPIFEQFKPIQTVMAETKDDKSNNLKLEVVSAKGETVLNNGDTVYEGEYIKYNIKVTNTSDEDIANVKISTTIPEGLTYGELEADYNEKYEYKYEENTRSKDILIGTLKAGESWEYFYETKVNDLQDTEEQKEVSTNISVYSGETKANDLVINNIVKQADTKLLMVAACGPLPDTWTYLINIDSTNQDKKEVNISLPKDFSFESILDQDSKEPTSEIQQSENNQISTFLEPGTWFIGGSIDRKNMRKEYDNDVILYASLKVKSGDTIYTSNECRILYKFDNVEITMESENEGEKVKIDEDINYKITVKNTGGINVQSTDFAAFEVNVKDFLPDFVVPEEVIYDNFEEEEKDSKEETSDDGTSVTSYLATGVYKKYKETLDISEINKDLDGNKLANVDVYITIPYGETAEIYVKTKADYVEEETQVKNSSTVSGDSIKAKTSNIVTHTIIPYDDNNEYDDKQNDKDDDNNEYDDRQNDKDDNNEYDNKQNDKDNENTKNVINNDNNTSIDKKNKIVNNEGNLNIDKYISNVKVTTNSGIKEKSYSNEKMAKAEIKAKELDGAKVEVTYNIAITNNTGSAKTIGRIIDKLPEGFEISSNNNNWVKNNNGEYINTSLLNKEINSGERTELKLIATKTMTENSTGTYTNIAGLGRTIEQSNTSKADIIISVSTGNIIIYISLIIGILSIMAIGIYLTKKYGLNVTIKLNCFILILMILFMTTYSEVNAASFHWHPTTDKAGGYNIVNGKLEKVGGSHRRFAGSRKSHNESETGTCGNPGAYPYRAFYETSINIITKESHSKVKHKKSGDFSKANSTINTTSLDATYCLIGPFKISNTSGNVPSVVVKNNKSANINRTICDSSGKTITMTKNTTTFYLKIKKSDQVNGIKSVVATCDILCTDTQTYTVKWKEVYYTSDRHNGGKTPQPVVRDETQSQSAPSSSIHITEKKVTWTGIQTPDYGSLDILKEDADSGIGLSDVVINVRCDAVGYNQDLTTEPDGEIHIDNLKPGEYTLTEKSNPHYGYIANATGKVTVIGGETASAILPNRIETGDLVINKKDKDKSDINLEGVEFRLKKDGNYVRLNDADSLTGTQRITKLTNANANGSNATTLITDDDGTIELNNIETGNYSLEEIGLSEDDEKYYEVDGDYIYNGNSNTPVGNNASGKPNSIPISITRKNKSTVNVNNRRKYVDLSGYVWEDITPVGKGAIRNNIFEDEDKDVKIENIKVTLKNSNGTNVQDPEYTNSDGYYIFEKVNIDNLSGYYLEFEYDGEIYTTTKSFNEQGQNNSNAEANTSKAQEIDIDEKGNPIDHGRTYVDNKYNNVVGTTSEDQSRVNDSFNVKYNLTRSEEKDAKAKSINRAIFEGQLSETTRNVRGFGTEEYKQIMQKKETPDNDAPTYENYDTINRITATTKETGYGALGGETANTIRQKGITELSNRNCGLVEREQVDLAVTTDLDNVRVEVNGYKNTYTYGKGATVQPETDENGNPIRTQEEQFRLDIKAKKWGYFRTLYASDIIQTDKETCKVYLTYSIKIRNNSNTLSAKVNRLANYHKEGYELKSSWFGDKAIEWSNATGLSNEYQVQYTNNLDSILPQISAGTFQEIMVEYELSNEEVVRILRGDISYDNIFEIDNYTSYYGDSTYYHNRNLRETGNIYASIDSNSAPGNATPGNISTYEDDTMAAPTITLKLSTSERTIEGNVFEDMPTEASLKNNERIGNGIYDKDIDGDNDAGNVKVELFEYDESVQTDEAGQPLQGIGNYKVENLAGMWVSYLPEGRKIGDFVQGTSVLDGRYEDYETSDVKEPEKNPNKIEVKNGQRIPAQVKTDQTGHYKIYGIIPGKYILKFTYGDGTVIYKNGEEPETLNGADRYKSTIIASDEIKNRLNNSPKTPSMWYKTTENEERTSDAVDAHDSKDNDATLHELNASNQNNPSKSSKSAYSLPLNIKLENVNTEPNSDDNAEETKEQVDETGEQVIKTNPDGTQQVETVFRYNTQNVDFGIIKRPKQDYELQKEITNIKLTLANGQVLIDGNPKDQNLQYKKYLPIDGIRANILNMEIDNELIQGSTLEATYKIIAINKSEVNYLKNNYYYYGSHGENDPIEKITISKVIDYLSNDLIFDKNSVSGDIEVGRIEIVDGKEHIVVGEKDLGEASKYLTEEAINSAKKYNNILILQNDNEISPNDSGAVWEYKASRVLAASEKLEYNNNAETIEVKAKIPSEVNNLGNLDPDATEPKETIGYKETDYYGQQIAITNPTGENRNIIIYAISGFAMLVIVGGLVIIKRKVLK